ncbi:MAG: hypothetical protein IJE68_05480 [Clostridia bacterium]|nr:hypothetical protein [Clostridia bacterium]
MIKTLSLKRLFELPKLKMRKSERVYDKEWHMFFPCEEARLEFRERIARAEKNIAEGRYHTQEEVDEYFLKKYGI